MHNKSIFSLISFFLLSMFYVSSASAAAREFIYVKVEMPKECGAWEIAPKARHCIVNDFGNKGKAGMKGHFRCEPKSNKDPGVFGINSQGCGKVKFSLGNRLGNHAKHLDKVVIVVKGEAYRNSVVQDHQGITYGVEYEFIVCKPGTKKRSRGSYRVPVCK
jgi:hypothetical protein